MTETTLDNFFGGQLIIEQPKTGYRAGADPVFLASAVPARPGQRVLELGAGVGTATLCLMRRVPDLDVTAIERDADLAFLAGRNAQRNALSYDIVHADLQALPANLRNASFDHVFANPPFFDRSRGNIAMHPGREAGRGETTPIAVWIDVGTRRLRQGGTLTMIVRTSRLADVVSAMDQRLGSLHIWPLAARAGRAADLLILTARKGGRADPQLAAPIILHDGTRHEKDGDSYSKVASAVLRGGLSLRDALLIED